MINNSNSPFNIRLNYKLDNDFRCANWVQLEKDDIFDAEKTAILHGECSIFK